MKAKRFWLTVAFITLLCGIFVSTFLLCFPFRKEETAVTASAASAQVVVSWSGGSVTIRGTGTVTLSDGKYLWLGKPTSYETDFSSTATIRHTFSGMGIHSGAGSLNVNDGTYVCTGKVESYENGSWVKRHEATATIQVISLPTLTQDSSQRIYSSNYSGRTVTEFKYSHTASSSYPSSASTSANISQSFTEEGNYRFYVNNGYENQTYTFTIDKTAPVLTLNGVSDGEATNGNVSATWSTATGSIKSQISHPGDSLTVRYSRSTSGYPTTASTSYTAGTELSEEGYYLMAISDAVGNSTSYRFLIDKTAPTLQVNGSAPAGNRTYGNGSRVVCSDNFRIAAESCTVRKVELSADGIHIASEAQSFASESGAVLTESGLYTYRLTDTAGNERVEEFLVIADVYSYNRERMTTTGYLKSDNYRVRIPYLKTVTIPTVGKDGKISRYAGAYSNANAYLFASRENAVAFMTEIEIAECVTDNGNGTYKYKQRNNANAFATYRSAEELRAVAEYYATQYVAEYGELRPNSSVYLDGSTVALDEAVFQPYTKSGELLIGGDYKFQRRNLEAGVYSYCTLERFIIRKDGAVLYDGAFNGTRTFAEYAGTNGGIFEIEERDSLGNATVYFVFYDVTAPTFSAEYGYYEAYMDESGKRQSRVIGEQIVMVNNYQIDGNLKYLSLTALSDEYDPIVTAKVEQPNGEELVTRDVTLLTFGADGNFKSGGEYHLKLYDRSLNVFDYVFVIEGAPPRVSSYVKGIGDGKTLFMEFSNGTGYSSIVSFTIYRYGVPLPTDGVYEERIDGAVVNTVKISQTVWSYSFYLGGVYTVRFEDSFGRVTESDEIIFGKGLPTYTLTGVTDGGKTNKAVKLTFKSTTGYEVTQDGIPRAISGGIVTEGYRLEIAATAENNGAWEIKLYNRSDPQTYVILRFAVDTAAPAAHAVTTDGEAIAWSTTIRNEFRIRWESGENVAKVRYTVNGGYTQNYELGQTLTEGGRYAITVTDDVGNSSVYELELDMTVSYSVSYSGDYYLESGATYVKSGFSVVSGESLAMTVSRDGKSLAARFESEYAVEGRYEIELRDGIGNTATFVVIVDQTPPSIQASQSDAYAAVTVTVAPNDCASIRILKNGRTYQAEIDESMTFTEWGFYAVTVKDRLGNASSCEFEILKVAPVVSIYAADGTELSNGAETGQSVYFVWNDEAATGRLTYGGIARTYAQSTVRYADGEYTLTVTDEAGNKVTASVTVIKSVQFTLRTESGGELTTYQIKGQERTNQPFCVQAASGLHVTAEKDGQAIAYGVGQLLEADGVYSFRIYDDLGNEERRSVVLDTTAPRAVVIPGADEFGAVRVEIDASDAESVTVVCLAAGKRTKTNYSPEAEYAFTAWGEYTVTVTDALGNARTAEFSISKRPASITITTVSGRVLRDGEQANESVYIECEENAVIRYTVGSGYRRVYQAETILSESGAYLITATDEAGNVTSFTCTLDTELLFTVLADGITQRNADEIAASKRYVEITLLEAMIAEYSRDDDGFERAIGTTLRFEDEGKYELRLSDEVGNKKTVYFTIDRTPPLAYTDNERETTKDDVVLTVADLNDVASYKVTKDGYAIPKYVLGAYNAFTESGSYTVRLTDSLNNRRELSFTIKREIGYRLSVPNGFISSGVVSLQLSDQGVTVTACRDGEEIELSGEYTFAADGRYELVLRDNLGNVAELSFTIDTVKYRKEFRFELPLGGTVTLLKDGKEADANAYLSDNVFCVTEDGEYTLTFHTDGGTASYSFVVDTTTPCLMLSGELCEQGAEIGTLKADFTIESSKRNCTIELYFNGDLVEYRAGESLSANGHYRVVITDNVGNTVEYEFDKAFTFNAGAITLFVMCGVAVALVAALIIRHRLKMKIR